jgi:hypothetical protein
MEGRKRLRQRGQEEGRITGHWTMDRETGGQKYMRTRIQKDRRSVDRRTEGLEVRRTGGWSNGDNEDRRKSEQKDQWCG